MTPQDLLKTAQNLPLHDPARVALLDAYRQIVELRQALDYANEARGGIGSLKRLIAEKNQQLDDARIDRSNLLCACARIGHGCGNAEDYSATARAAISGLCDRAAEEVDNPEVNHKELAEWTKKHWSFLNEMFGCDVKVGGMDYEEIMQRSKAENKPVNKPLDLRDSDCVMDAAGYLSSTEVNAAVRGKSPLELAFKTAVEAMAGDINARVTSRYANNHIKRCATCKWRTLDGACINDEKIHEDDYEKRAETTDHLYYSYYEGGDFMVQPNFGCVHWAENDVDNPNRID